MNGSVLMRRTPRPLARSQHRSVLPHRVPLRNFRQPLNGIGIRLHRCRQSLIQLLNLAVDQIQTREKLLQQQPLQRRDRTPQRFGQILTAHSQPIVAVRELVAALQTKKSPLLPERAFPFKPKLPELSYQYRRNQPYSCSPHRDRHPGCFPRPSMIPIP